MCIENVTSEFCKLHGNCSENSILCKHYDISTKYRETEVCRECTGYKCKFERGEYTPNFQI